MPPHAARTQRTLVLLGGGGFSDGESSLLLERWVLGLCSTREPRVCFVPTASGDSEAYIDRFHGAFRTLPCTPSVLRLFRREVDDLEAFVAGQELIFVGGGNTVNLLAVWRAHALDRILAKAYRDGVLLSGVSAGALCWLSGGVTDSLGPLSTFRDGLGLVKDVSGCSHYGDDERREQFRRAVRSGELGPGYGIEDGVALRLVNGTVTEVVAERAGAKAWRVEQGDGELGERELPVRQLRDAVVRGETPSTRSARDETTAPAEAGVVRTARRAVYTDGACSGNPGPGGWAWAVPNGAYAAGSAAHTTNQRMEVQAVLEALRALEGPLEVVSDSTYVVNCFKQGWWKTWRRNGWRNSQRKPVANRDLWEPLIDLATSRDVVFRWVKGHGADGMNDLVDRLAVAAGQSQTPRRGRVADLHG
ncbi:MAG TPA: Type 1 glutamine amidotransferase-like domain-containing protein [Polyangiaceae bacterium]